MRRNELGTLNRERAQWFNQYEVERRQKASAAAEDAVAEKKRVREEAKQKKESERVEAEQRRMARKDATAARKLQAAADAERIANKKRLIAAGVWCYCEQKDDGKTYLACGGAQKCPLRQWVHATCARTRGDTVTAAMTTNDEQFWCTSCLQFKPYS